MKTSELTGAALDWAVAKCEGFPNYEDHGRNTPYSTDWSQGGPIIEREGIQLRPAGRKGARFWLACPEDTPYYGDTSEGPTPLIAAMRCYVASKLGDDVDLPEELS